MKLLVIVLCLLSERYLIHARSFHRFAWFGSYATAIRNAVGRMAFLASPWWAMAAIVLLPLLLVGALLYLLCGWLYGIPSLIVQLVIFFSCIGPDNPFYPSPEDAPTGKKGAGWYFSRVNGQLFAPIFWYIVAGALGVLLYRLVAMAAKEDGMKRSMGFCLNVLDWLPARLLAILCLMVGNFQRGFRNLIAQFLDGPARNARLLERCGKHALGVAGDEVPGLSEAEGLAEHALVLLLVFLALFTLVAWL